VSIDYAIETYDLVKVYDTGTRAHREEAADQPIIMGW